MHRSMLATLSALFLIACSDATAPDEASRPLLQALVAHDRVVTELTGLETLNECTGETIFADGTLTTVLHQVTTPSGGTQLMIHQTAKASGLSDLGVRYNLILVTSAADIDHGTTDASVLTVPFTLKLVGQGPGNDYYMRSLVHITTNADGVLTSYIDRTEFGCQ